MRLLLLSSLLLLFPVQAQGANDTGSDVASTDYSKLAGEDLFRQLSESPDPIAEAPCAKGVPLFGELVRRLPEAVELQRALLLSRVFCSAENGENAAADAAFIEYAKITPDHGLDMLGAGLAVDSNNHKGMLESLSAFEPKTLSAMVPTEFWYLYRSTRDAGFEADFESLALGWYDRKLMTALPPELHSGVAKMAIGAALKAGRQDDAAALLPLVQSPQAFISLLSLKKYRAIWPQIEHHVGPNLKNVSEAHADWTLARFQDEPSDRDRFSEAAYGMLFAGRYQEAVQHAQDWRNRDVRGEKIEEGDGWALNIQAYAYDALGEPEKARVVFDELAALDAEEHPWVVNFVVNRASRLVGLDQNEAGLQATQLAWNVADNHGSDFARMLVARDRVCALYRLDRANEAERDLAFLREKSSVSAEVAVEGLLCAKLEDEAEALVLNALENGVERSKLLDALRAPNFILFYTPSNFKSAYDLMLERPQIATSVSRYWRQIPEEFTPIATLRRSKASPR